MSLTKAQIADQRRALHELLDAVNNNSQVARALGLPHRQIIGHWLRSGMITNPAKVMAAVELAKSRGVDIAPHRFRPDIFPAPKGYKVTPESHPIPGYDESSEQRYIKPSMRSLAEAKAEV